MSILDRIMGLLDQRGGGMRMYQRFERLIGLALSVAVSVIILFALAHLIQALVTTLSGGLAEFDYRVFQRFFELILTVLIALEFNHSLAEVVKGRGSLVQVKIVVLIGILVVVRKFILLDIEQTPATYLLGLSAAVLALGIVYWIVVDVDRRLLSDDEEKHPERE